MANQTQTAERLAAQLQPLVSVRSFVLVTYGLGNVLRPELIKTIGNRNFVKPKGGLWASPVASAYGWKEWCEAEQFGDLSTHFEFRFTGKTLTIDSEFDLLAVPWQGYGPDFEAMAASGIDAVYLTEAGQDATRFSDPGLYGWDCECVLVMNRGCVTAR